jgi:hypothetical protein
MRERPIGVALLFVTEESASLPEEEFARWWAETGEHELRQVLYWKWDPIGVNDVFPASADEYDHYAPKVVSALRGGARENEVVDLLRTFETEWMGLSGDRTDHLRTVAEDIVGWFEESQDRWRELGPVRR